LFFYRFLHYHFKAILSFWSCLFCYFEVNYLITIVYYKQSEIYKHNLIIHKIVIYQVMWIRQKHFLHGGRLHSKIWVPGRLNSSNRGINACFIFIKKNASFSHQKPLYIKFNVSHAQARATLTRSTQTLNLAIVQMLSSSCSFSIE